MAPQHAKRRPAIPTRVVTPMARPPASVAESEAVRVHLVGRLLLVALTLMFIVVLGRVFALQVFPGEKLRAHVDERLRVTTEEGRRGDLLDRRGRVLATSRVGRRVAVDPLRFPEPYEQSVLELARAMGASPEKVASRILARIEANFERTTKGERLIRYVSVEGPLPEDRAQAVRYLKMPGVWLEKRWVRETMDTAVAPIVGRVGVDHNGLLGGELYHEQRLRPDDGAVTYMHDPWGRALWIEFGGLDAPEHGQDVRLSVDLEIQRIVMEELQRGVDKADASGGRVVALDPRTGEVLAMGDIIREPEGLREFSAQTASLLAEADPPRFRVVHDPNRDETYPALARNRCVEDAYEPGSTFKAFMWSSVVELGLANPEEEIETEGGAWRTPYGRLLRDVAHVEKQSWRNVLVRSSNIGMAKVCRRMTNTQAQRAIRRFGFGAPSGVGLPGESAGIVTSSKNWSEYTHTSVSMGYEIAVTPAQMVRAFSVFARSGALSGTLPRIRVRAVEADEIGADPLHRVLPAWVALLTRDAMAQVAQNLDTKLQREGKAESEPRYEMFGKSGTSKIARPDGKGYFPKQYVSSFIAGAPLRNPQIVVLVVIDDPGPEQVARGKYYGSDVAGPVVRRIVERALPYLGTVPTTRGEKNERVASAVAGTPQ